jgi:DeoR/GlpR family transcriptional regulator of sugar metabolism
MQRVLELLKTRDSVHVAELADEFSVSAVTVRHDLSELARQGLVARVRGGVRGLQRGQSELAFDVRLHLQSPEKRAIASAAAAMVGDGESVRSTRHTAAYYLALELRKKHEIVVVTNGL